MKKQYKTIIFLVICCLFVNIFSFIIFDLPVWYSQKIGVFGEYIVALSKIIICLIIGAIFAYKTNIIFVNQIESNPLEDGLYKQYFFRKYFTYVFLLLMFLLIYYFVPQISWSIINFICSDSIMNRNTIDTTLNLKDIVLLCLGNLFSFSSIAAYIGCTISYLTGQYYKIIRLCNKRAIIQ